MTDTAAVLGALIVVAVALAWPVPRAMAGLTSFRGAPRAALVVWQATSVAAVLAALAAAPVALRLVLGPEASAADHVVPALLAATVTGLVLARLLLSGHRVGTRLRSNRRRHRELVDLLGTTDHGHEHRLGSPRHTRVLEHPTPTAYCVPGLRRRVVLTQGAIDALPDEELDAVLAHERAHLSARHDLVLEFFTVAHEAVPRFVRSDPALSEVNLLIEVLADRAAVRETDVVTTARAITHMAGGGVRPDGTLSMGGTPSAARLRMGLLDSRRVARLPLPVAAALMYSFAAVILALPVALLVLAFTA